jgi:MinD-like ATPase involved in chromosome partitioning or flagellar assembly
MSVAILTAVGDAGAEADLAASLAGGEAGLRVVRRCVDLADLLAAAAAGVGRAVVLAADLRHLDREALARLAAEDVAVVGLVTSGDEAAEHRLHRLGVRHVLARDASVADVAAAVRDAITGLAEPDEADEPEDATSADLDPGPLATPASTPPVTVGEPPGGTIVAVWGAAGAPGRSTVAANLAAELAELGRSTLLVDADTYGGALAQLTGVLDESSGIAAACRLANAGTLDACRLTEVALEVRPSFRVLTGITRPDRWLEVRAAAFGAVLALARTIVGFVVIDCGFCLEQDEELVYDTAAPRRNGATLAALSAADVVAAVTGADPIALARYVRALPDCAEASPSGTPVTVVNRLRDGVVRSGDPRRAVSRALDRYAGITRLHMVPDDPAAVDAALVAGRVLAESAPRSPARLAIRDLAASLAGAQDEPGRSRVRGRRRSAQRCR